MEEELKSNKEISGSNVLLLWGLFWIGLFTAGTTSIIAVIWAYVARGEDRTDIENSHFTYAIRTFWWSFLWTIIGAIGLMFIIGVPILIIAGIWYFYRIIKATIYAMDKKAIK